MLRDRREVRPEPLGSALAWRLMAIISYFIFFHSVAAIAEPGEKRIALLIANADYVGSAATVLSAPKDARLLLEEVRRLDFDAELRSNVGRDAMQAAIDAFTARISPGSVALLYFTGFGLQAGRTSYLVPVDAKIAGEDDIRREGIEIDAVLTEMDRRGARVKIVIVDAARRNPFERQFRGFFAGLASGDAPGGTLALYAAAPGKLGLADAGDVSLFMSELSKELRSPNISAEEMFTHARVGVSRASNGEQVPWVASSLMDDFFFGTAPARGDLLKEKAQKRDGGAAPGEAAGTGPVPPEAQHDPQAAASPTSGTAEPARAAVPDPNGASGLPSNRPGSAIPSGAPGIAVQAAKPPTLPDAVPLRPTPAAVPARAPDVIQDCADCPTMVVLPAGSFTMGSGLTPFDRPTHRVTLAKPFAMARSETTFDQWRACVAAGGCGYQPNDRGWGGEDRPVINVSWSDVQKYVVWLSKATGHAYRLPSEAEWEYAARGGRETGFAWGPAIGARMANCRDCQADANARTLPVRSFAPNAYGLYDMAGNAAEWVQDCWNETYRSASRDGSAVTTGNCDQRVLRGGSFDSTAAYVKPSARFRYDSDVRYYANGFRVVRDLP